MLSTTHLDLDSKSPEKSDMIEAKTKLLNEYNEFIKELYERIFTGEVIKESFYLSTIEKLKAKEFTFCQVLVDNILKNERHKLSIQFKNYDNFNYYAEMLKIINTRISNKDNDFFEMNFALIFIGERSYCNIETKGKNKNSVKLRKLYLCNVLASKNKKIYNDKVFWSNLLTLKIENKLFDLCRNYSCM